MEVQTEIQTNAPICKTQLCKQPLTYLEDSKCWRCLICNPIPKDVPKPKEEKKFLDVAMTEERVNEILAERIVVSEERIKEIVQDELMNWHVPKPPVMKDEIAETLPISSGEANTITDVPKPETWLQKAKRLGVKTHYDEGGMRKKVDVLAEIEAKK